MKKKIKRGWKLFVVHLQYEDEIMISWDLFRSELFIQNILG